MTPSPDLQTLLDELRDPSDLPPTQETYDVSRARTLADEERKRYAAALSERIAAGDGRAALTAGQLGLVALVDTLRAATSTPGWDGLSIRRGLALLGDVGAIALLGKDLEDVGPMHRFAAALTLGEETIGDKAAAAKVLIPHLADGAMHVQGQVFKSLVRALGLERYQRTAANDDVELRSPLQRLDLLLGSSLAALREPALAEMKTIAERVLRGDSPESLGLVYTESVPRDVMLRLGRSLFTQSEMPLDEIEPLFGADRRYAEALIAKSLDRRLESAPPALARLGATWTVPAMEEAAGPLPKENAFRVAAEAAIAKLRRN